MINTLNIGKYIYETIKSDATLNSILASKIYPLVADNGVSYPFIVYGRTSLISSLNKDLYFEDTVNFEITIVADKYSKSIEIACKVRELFEKPHTTFNDMDINNTCLISATEEYTNDAYIQKLLFNTKIQEI